MNRFTIAAAVAATACIIGIPTVAALASDDSTHSRGPAHSQVDDRSGPNRGSDDVSPTSAVPTSGASEPGDDNGTHAEPGDDRGTTTEPGDDNGITTEPGDDNGTEPGDDRGTSTEPDDDRGTGVEPGDDRGTGVEPGDDSTGHGGRGGSGDDDSGHHGHGG